MELVLVNLFNGCIVSIESEEQRSMTRYQTSHDKRDYMMCAYVCSAIHQSLKEAWIKLRYTGLGNGLGDIGEQSYIVLEFTKDFYSAKN